MIRYIIVSASSGILFGILDGIINSNPLAQRLYAIYKPIAKASVNVPMGVAIDLGYGFILAAIFRYLYYSLPGKTGSIKGVSFGLLVWFFRIVMSAASNWIMFHLPPETLLYSIATGLAEMLIIGIIYGLTLRPAA